jgi:hypothetical protein
MTDNTDEKELGTSTNTHLDNPSDEITPTLTQRLLTQLKKLKIWKYTITPTCITNQKNGKNIFLNF